VHSHGFGVAHHGGYAEWARVPAAWVNPLPPGFSALDAITVGVAGYTAALAIDLMELNGCAPALGKVVVNGATGGVASVAIEILAQRGYEVVAVTSKPAQARYLRDLGAADIIAASDLDTGSRPLESAQWAAAVDSLGGEPLAGLLRTMARDGVVASIGNAAGIPFNTTVMPFILRGVRLIGVNSDNAQDVRERVWRRLGTDLRPRHLEDIRHVLPFDRLPGLVEDLIEGRHRGRAVIAVQDVS
jgi:acrylyl-CoA reductase (NADPH)